MNLQVFDFNPPSPEHCLAFDEALLNACDSDALPGALAFWEPRQPFVVLGYANRVNTEANVSKCQELAIPILRRCSGGGTVLQTPGCLNYSLVLPVDTPGFHSISSTNDEVMRTHAAALTQLLQRQVERQGHTDLTIGGLKFSGNAQRRKLRALIFHGCFLLHADLALIEATLLMPSKQPDYRANRPHRDFVVNLNVPAAAVKEALRSAWNATPAPSLPLSAEVNQLVIGKYSRPDWNFKF